MKELPEFLISPVQIHSKNVFACPILNSMFCVNLFYIEVAFIYQLELCYRMNRLQILDTHFRASNWNEQIVATFKGILVFLGVRIRDGQVIKYERKIFFCGDLFVTQCTGFSIIFRECTVFILYTVFMQQSYIMYIFKKTFTILCYVFFCVMIS